MDGWMDGPQQQRPEDEKVQAVKISYIFYIYMDRNYFKMYSDNYDNI